MLRWRAATELIALIYPDLTLGLYTPDEIGEVAEEQGRYVEPQRIRVVDMPTNGEAAEGPPVEAHAVDAEPAPDVETGATSREVLEAGILSALAALGTSRMDILREHRIGLSGGKPNLSAKSDDALRVIAAALGVLDETVDPEVAPASDAAAQPAPLTGATSDIVRLAAEAMELIEDLYKIDQAAGTSRLDETLRQHGYNGEGRAIFVQRITRADALADLIGDLRTAINLGKAQAAIAGAAIGEGDDIPFMTNDSDSTASLIAARAVRWA